MKFSGLLVGTGALLLSGSVLASAQDQAPKAAVIVGDLDLTQSSGQAEAERRLQASATASCPGGTPGVQAAAAQKACKDDLIQRGQAEIARLGAQQMAQRQAAQQRTYAAGYAAGRMGRGQTSHGSMHRRHHVVHHHVVHHHVVHHHVVHYHVVAAPDSSATPK